MIDYLICSFSNKTFLKSSEINNLIDKAISKRFKKKKITVSDGGEDLRNVLFEKKYLKFFNIKITSADYTKKKIKIPYCKKKKFALIQFSEIIGGFDKKFKNGMYRTSYGIGECINFISKKKIKKIIISTGGSTVSDCGVGMLSSLGTTFIDKRYKILNFEKKMNCFKLREIKLINFSQENKNLKKIKFVILSDSNVKLVGKYGQVKTFASQKNIFGNKKKILEQGYENFLKILSKKTKKKLNINYLGSGGGICTSLYSNFDATLTPATQFIFKKTNFLEKVKSSKTIISGEGIIDKSSFMGKGTGEIYKITKHYKKKLILIAGMNKYKKIIKNCKVVETNKNNLKLNKKLYFKILKKKINNEINEKN